MEIARVYLPTAGKLGEIRGSIRISMVFNEAACRRQASQRKEMRFLVFARQNARTKMLDTSKFFLVVRLTKLNKKSRPKACFFCDPAGIRTQDPYIKSVLLYQLSYGIGN